MAKQEMVKVELLTEVGGVDEQKGSWFKAKGDIYETTADDAKRMIDNGLARTPGIFRQQAN